MQNVALKEKYRYTEQIKELIKRILLEQEQGISRMKGSLNLFDINKISHMENYHTNIIATLIDRRQKHGHPEFGERFIQAINNSYPESPLPPYTPPITVFREKSIDSGRIDIFIETDTFVLIIENKIYAPDDNDQLHKYYEWGLRTFFPKNKKVILCYLTLHGTLPKTKSLTEKKRKELAAKGQYYALSYSTEILSWLESLQVSEDEEILDAALVQYKDLIRGICGVREEDVMGLALMIKNMEEMCANASKSELKEIIENTQVMGQSCLYYLFRQLLTEVVENLSTNIHIEKEIQGKIFFTHHQKRFAIEDRAVWESSITKDFKNVGVEVSFDEYAGIGIELDNLLDTPELTYGIMSHGKTETNAYSLENGWNSYGYTINVGNNTWWKVFVPVNYVVTHLFYEPKSTIDLASQITTWFVETWNHNHNVPVK